MNLQAALLHSDGRCDLMKQQWHRRNRIRVEVIRPELNPQAPVRTSSAEADLRSGPVPSPGWADAGADGLRSAARGKFSQSAPHTPLHPAYDYLTRHRTTPRLDLHSTARASFSEASVSGLIGRTYGCGFRNLGIRLDQKFPCKYETDFNNMWLSTTCERKSNKSDQDHFRKTLLVELLFKGLISGVAGALSDESFFLTQNNKKCLFTFFPTQFWVYISIQTIQNWDINSQFQVKKANARNKGRIVSGVGNRKSRILEVGYLL